MNSSKKFISVILALLIFTAGMAVVLSGCDSKTADGFVVSDSGEASLTEESANGEPSEAEPQESYATMTFTGDVLIHKSVFSGALQDDGSYDFKPYFSLVNHVFDSDINMANMEGPVDALGGNKDIDTYPCFNAPVEILDALKDVGINTLITSNNHVYDRSRSGCIKTRQNIIDRGIDAIGTYETQEQADTPYIKEINGIKIGMAAFTDSTNGVKISKEYSGFTINFITLNDKGIEKILGKVQQLRDAGAEYIVTLFHWGAEYIDKPTAEMRKVAQAMVDNGVDLVVGNHSHCVQPIVKKTSTYNGKQKDCIIVYSLGNFFVNQTGLNKPKTQYGMIVKLKLKKDAQGEISVENASYTPTFMYYNKEADNEDMFRVMVAGEYANAAERPEFFANDNDWKKCAAAIEHVKSVVGNDIECRETLREE